MSRARWLLGSAVLLAGCQFDASVPLQTRVTCLSDSDCPRGLKCEPALKLCKPVGDRGPVLTASVDNAWAKLGTVVHLSLESDTELLEPPRVSALLGTMLLEVPRDEAAAGLVYPLTVTADLPEGLVRFVAEAYSSAGTPAQNPALTPTVVVDTTAPRLLLSASSVTPPAAVNNTSVAIRAVFTEDVAPGATLAVSGASSSLVLSAESAQNGTATFIYHVVPGSPDGVVTLAVQGVTDLAGNPLAGSPALPDLVVDNVAPVLTSPGVQGTRYSANAGHNMLSVPVHCDDPTADVTVWFGTHSQLAHDGDVVTFNITSVDPEGPDNVVLTARDAAGNFARDLWETVVVDFTAPDVVGSPLLQFTLPQGCPLTRTSALGTGMTATVVFNISEQLGPAATVAAGPLPFTTTGGAGQVWEFSATVPSTVPNGQYALTAQLEDDVGNAAARVLTTIEVATAPPAPLTQAQLDGLTYQRIPWGSDGTGGLPRFSVVGTPGSLPPGHSLVFWSGAAPTVSVMLGRGTALADGSLPRSNLVAVDRPQIFAQHYDGACNVEGPTAVLVKNVETVATLGGKVVGSLLPNPNRFEARALIADSGVSRETPVAAVVSVGGGVQSTGASGVWQMALEQIAPNNTAGGYYFDGDRGRVVAFSNDGGGAFSFDGTQWYRDGNPPPVPAAGVAVWDSFRHLTVLLSGGRTYESDGGTWVDRGTGPAGGLASITVGGVVYAPDRHLTYAMTMSGLGAFNGVSQWDGVSWTQVAPTPGVNMYGVMLGYFASAGKLLALGGYTPVAGNFWSSTGVYELDGGGWSALPAMPQARHGGSTAFDPVHNKLLVAGGVNGSSTGQPANIYTAIFDGTSWDPNYFLTAPGYTLPNSLNPVNPLTYDAARGNVACPGARGYAVWSWLDAGWVENPSDIPALPPVTATNAAMALVHDPSRGASVLVGNPTWELTDAGWASHAVTLPPTRAGANLGYDPNTGTVLLTSGAVSAGNYPAYTWTYPADTWAYDGGGWAPLTPTASPPGRGAASSFLDTTTGRLQLLGGCRYDGLGNCTTVMTDAWEFTGTTWQASASLLPPAGFRDVYFDVARGRQVALMMDAGTMESISGTWTPVPGASAPPISYGSNVYYDEALAEGVVDAYPSVANGPLAGSYTYDGTSWTWANGTPAPSARRLVYDAARARVIALETSGGHVMWERKLSASIGPAHLVALSCADVIPAGAAAVQVAPSFVTGGQSVPGAGAQLQALLGGNQWKTLASSAAPTTAPAALTATITDATTLGQLCTAGAMNFEATTLGGSDYVQNAGKWQGRRAQVATDYVEVTVQSRFP